MKERVHLGIIINPLLLKLLEHFSLYVLSNVIYVFLATLCEIGSKCPKRGLRTSVRFHPTTCLKEFLQIYRYQSMGKMFL